MNFKIKVFDCPAEMNKQSRKQRQNIIKDEDRILNQNLQRLFLKGVNSTGYELINFQLETKTLRETAEYIEFKLYDNELKKYYFINIKNYFLSDFTNTISDLINELKSKIISSYSQLGKTALNEQNEALKAISNINNIIDKRLTKKGTIGKLQGNEEEKILINFLKCLHYYNTIQCKMNELNSKQTI